ncbi:hypothetical protein FB446DRAFT_842999 [Lentinula raphanica]|nr:hypothetical protein FB446DRAFT_842999 [Lentinula raphanica]
MLLSHISAYLILGLFSTVTHAAPTPSQAEGTPATPVTADKDDYVMYDSTGSGHPEKVFGPFTTRVKFSEALLPNPMGPFSAAEAYLPDAVRKNIENVKSTRLQFRYEAPLEFETRWPSRSTSQHNSKRIQPTFHMQIYGELRDQSGQIVQAVPAGPEITGPVFPRGSGTPNVQTNSADFHKAVNRD